MSSCRMEMHFRTKISILTSVVSLISLACAATPCYMPTGQLATSEFQPCNNVPSGSYSACCNLGKTVPDVCLGGGLCQRTDTNDANSMIYAVGCTDKTGKDPACQQLCTGSTSYFYALQPCADGTWCCNNLSSTSCCKNNQGDFAFNLTSLSLGQSQKSPTSTLTVTSGVATVTSSSTCSVSAGSEKTCPADKSTVIGASVGAILGTLLIVSLCALFFVSRRLREQGQKHVDSDTGMAGEWRTELDATKGVMKYEIDGREVRHP